MKSELDDEYFISVKLACNLRILFLKTYCLIWHYIIQIQNLQFASCRTIQILSPPLADLTIALSQFTVLVSSFFSESLFDNSFVLIFEHMCRTNFPKKALWPLFSQQVWYDAADTRPARNKNITTKRHWRYKSRLRTLGTFLIRVCN